MMMMGDWKGFKVDSFLCAVAALDDHNKEAERE